MSITYDRQMYVFQCDTCHEALETLETAWPAALKALLGEKWQPVKLDKGYAHKCPDCVKVGK